MKNYTILNKKYIILSILIFHHSLIFAQEYVLDTVYYPATCVNEKNTAIMVFGGSDGGYPSSAYYGYVYNELTKLGYPCMGVAYFKTENTPKNLTEIPLEYFKQAINDYLARPEIKGKKLVLIGISKGGELVLLLASKYPEIKGVIAWVPSHVIWQGINADFSVPNFGSWSYQEEPLPYVPYLKDYDLSSAKKNNFGNIYQLSLQQKEYIEKATIPVEDIKGAVLIVSGEDDKVWPSTFMGNEVIERLKENNFPYWYRHDAYENAGHAFFRPDRLKLGGTVEGNRKAKIGFEKSILEFIEIVEKK